MKASLLTGVRALAVALSIFALLAVGGIEVKSSRDVFIFVIGLVVLWVVIERVFLTIMRKPKRPDSPPGPPPNAH